MTTQRRKGRAGVETPPQVQPNAVEFPPNPMPPVRTAPQEPVERAYEVTGPHEVGGVRAPGVVLLTLSPGAEKSLIESGSVVPYEEPEPEDTAPDPVADEEPMTGTDKEGD